MIGTTLSSRMHKGSGHHERIDYISSNKRNSNKHISNIRKVITMTKAEMDKWIKSLEHALYMAGTYEEPVLKIEPEDKKEEKKEGNDNE